MKHCEGANTTVPNGLFFSSSSWITVSFPATSNHVKRMLLAQECAHIFLLNNNNQSKSFALHCYSRFSYTGKCVRGSASLLVKKLLHRIYRFAIDMSTFVPIPIYIYMVRALTTSKATNGISVADADRRWRIFPKN